MTYQRGTDLKHCPDGCRHIHIESTRQSYQQLLCSALPPDTCPREQSKNKEAPSTCQYCGGEVVEGEYTATLAGVGIWHLDCWNNQSRSERTNG